MHLARSRFTSRRRVHSDNFSRKVPVTILLWTSTVCLKFPNYQLTSLDQTSSLRNESAWLPCCVKNKVSYLGTKFSISRSRKLIKCLIIRNFGSSSCFKPATRLLRALWFQKHYIGKLPSFQGISLANSQIVNTKKPSSTLQPFLNETLD